MFVVDSSDVARICEARDELVNVLTDDTIEEGVPCVILANKQDRPEAVQSLELVERMKLRELRGHPWYVQEMCAVTGDGLHEGVKKMAEMVKEFVKLSKRKK